MRFTEIYEAGKPPSVESPEVSIPIPVADGQTMNLPMRFNYNFEVQKGDGSRGLTKQGMIFRITPDGALTVVHSFFVPPTNPCTDGYSPMGGLIQSTDGNFYGTTFGGGTYDGSAVFKIAASGKLTTLYNFCSEGYPCANGGHPSAALVQDRDGDFYGTTYYGGDYYAGTIFRITPQGALSVHISPFG